MDVIDIPVSEDKKKPIKKSMKTNVHKEKKLVLTEKTMLIKLKRKHSKDPTMLGLLEKMENAIKEKEQVLHLNKPKNILLDLCNDFFSELEKNTSTISSHIIFISKDLDEYYKLNKAKYPELSLSEAKNASIILKYRRFFFELLKINQYKKVLNYYIKNKTSIPVKANNLDITK